MDQGCCEYDLCFGEELVAVVDVAAAAAAAEVGVGVGVGVVVVVVLLLLLLAVCWWCRLCCLGFLVCFDFC